MALELICTIKAIGKTTSREYNGKTYYSRKVWLDNTRNESYPSTPEFEVEGDRCSILDNFQAGDRVKASIDIQGRKYQKDGKDKIFNKLTVWKLEKVEEANAMPPQTGQPETVSEEADDDLPF